jgi:hypothetical protein
MPPKTLDESIMVQNPHESMQTIKIKIIVKFWKRKLKRICHISTWILGLKKKNLRHLPKVTTTYIMPPPTPSVYCSKKCVSEFFSQNSNMSNPSWKKKKTTRTI